jgi:flagellar hook-associated protein 1 FlgK
VPISTFLGVETALRGILAQQRSLDVTGHNIANANTVGYTRQEAVLAPTPALRYPPNGQIGTGVDVAQYTRMRDDFVDVQLRAQSMLKGYHEARQDGLKQVELSLSEPGDSGISALLGKFWSAWQDLANNPEDLATRQSLLQSGSSLAGAFQGLRSQLTTIDSQTQTNIGLTLNDLNSTVSSIAALDQSIMASVAQGEQPSNDLLDQRDVLLDKVGNLVNLSATKQADGSVTLKVGSFTLCAGGVPTAVGSVAAFGNDPITGLPNLTSGKLAGLVAFDTQLTAAGTGYIAQLDTVAGSLIAGVNAIQNAGFTLYGTAATGPFFSGTTAADIAVDAGVAGDPKLIAASDAANQPGNAQNALAIAGLRGGASIDGAYTTLIAQIGADSQDAQRNAKNAAALTDALENRRQSISGVSVDEEMTNLVRFQRGFQASARALSAMDEMIDTLINRTGKVGL